ncbi:MAG: potassium channel family protein [Aestuariivita sp.]|uniref:potassium channel family protein n=1 Tax=Aestuariivita sp. TaxID=1872407 RepID=UPI003BAFCDA9
MAQRLKDRLTQLYEGASPGARRFRYALIIFDFASILLFIAIVPLQQTPLLGKVVFGLGVLIFLDFAARLWIATDRLALLRRIYMIADVVVIASLLISPFIEGNLAFLRILRGLRLIHSYHLLQDLRRVSPFFQKHEEELIAGVNLFVFVFFTTSVVFSMFAQTGAGFQGYIDALYFTVTTLTTTGYGDIVPQTTGGKLFSVVIMVVGVALFVQLARAIFRPAKVHYECPSCALTRHDFDAVHCKHCGTILHIKTPGSE